MDIDEGNKAENGTHELSTKQSRYTTIFLEILSKLSDPAVLKKNILLINLLVEAPHLPDEVLDIIRSYCVVPDSLALGLSVLHKLIIRRPANREKCTNIVLKLTWHEDEKVRTDSIRLVASKLHSEKYLVNVIEAYAAKLLRSLTKNIRTEDMDELLASDSGSIQDEGESEAEKMEDATFDQDDNIKTEEKTSGSSDANKVVIKEEKKDGEEPQQGEQKSEANGEEEAQKFELTEDDTKRRILLYIALCTKKHDLISGLISTYVKSPNNIKKVLHKQITPLIRAIGTTEEVLRVLSNFPQGGETFVLHIIHILTENELPPPQLISTVKMLYEKRVQNVRFLLPIIIGLSKEEVISYLPKLVMLKPNVLKPAITRLLTTQPSPLTPQELLLQLHLVEFKGEQVHVKKIIEAIQMCLEHKALYNDHVLAVVIQQLFDGAQLPSLFLRTVIQAITLYPKLVTFSLNILTGLIQKQIWNDKVLWSGFIQCCKMTQPHSYNVLVQLPRPQLEDVLSKAPEFKEPLIAYCKRNPSGIPRATLQLLQPDS
eukprot:TRINITY_DN4833_c0_g3_i1.p1 TRINITY_DN4833_c0_g3~~TRINITY_DN4833_c0_g3_i1.p1  ORF type:complete len:617 (-),score=148.00 TRINITY_DN4833_c0_g3_i1:4-1632(-)